MFMENNIILMFAVWKITYPNGFMEKWLSLKNATAALLANALKTFAEIHLTLSMKNSLAIEFGRCSTNTGDGMVLKEWC